ncbi:MAG: hypothetical protein AABM40_05750 [Chloroflexota bacterium]
MTATITPITREMPDPTGTDFVRHVYSTGNETAFYAREPGTGDIEYSPLTDTREQERPAQRETNRKALRTIALDVLTEPRLFDPNVRYARAVHLAVITALAESDRISTNDVDELSGAFDIAVEYAANAVAAAWLRERGSIPIPSE